VVKVRSLILFNLTVMLLTPGCGPASPFDTAVGPDDFKYIAEGNDKGEYWPTTGWRFCSPETVGMDSLELAKAMKYAATPGFNTEGIVVVKNGYIVAEAYFKGFEMDERHTSHSMAKSFTSALIGIAIDKGFIAGIDEKLCQYYAAWDCDDGNDLRRKISIRHAMTLTTGLKWSEDWTKWDFSSNDALKMGQNGHFVQYMSARAGLHVPGERFYYSTGDAMLLTKVIQEATGMTAFEFAKQELFDPLNITHVSWERDRDGYTSTSWGLSITARDYAKFGYLFLNKGRWEDQHLVSEQWVERSTQTDPTVKMWNAYGYLWHVNLPLRLSRLIQSTDTLPADGYMAEGVKGQNIIIIPSRNLVIVKLADQETKQMDLVKFLSMILGAEKSTGGRSL